MERSKGSIGMATILSLFTGIAMAAPLGAEFTYQGRLTDAGTPGNEEFDMLFRLWAHATDADPGQLIGENCVDNVMVSGGLFTVELNFGSAALNVEKRWLEIAVQPSEPLGDDGCAAAASYTTLAPRQSLTAAPYAVHALSAPGSGLWQAAGNDISNTSAGNVGIGTPAPAAKLHVAGDLMAQGRIALGNSSELGPDGSGSDKVFDLSYHLTDFSSADYWYTFRSWLGIDPSADLPTEVIRGHSLATSIAQDNPNDVNIVLGLESGAGHFGTGTVSTLIGGNIGAVCDRGGHVDYQAGAVAASRVAQNGGSIDTNVALRVDSGHHGPSGSITDNFGVRVESPVDVSPITNHYGLYLADQSTAGTNSSFALYSNGGKSYFADAVGIGAPSPVGMLDISDAVGGDTSVNLPANAIAAAEQLDEPGVASQTRNTALTLDGSLQTLVSRSLTAPAAGYVMVIGTCQASVAHAPGPFESGSSCTFGVSDAAGTLPANQDGGIGLDTALPDGSYVLPVTAHGLFEVSAGLNTFYFLAQEFDGNWSAGNVQFTLAFFPTAYGPVAATLNRPSDEGRSGGLTNEEIAAERADAEAFDHARIQNELEAMRARIETLQRLLEARVPAAPDAPASSPPVDVQSPLAGPQLF